MEQAKTRFDNTVFWDADALSELSNLGLTLGDLAIPLHRALAASANTTPNHPRTFKGTMFWAEAVVGLREQLKSKGFEPKTVNNVEFCLNDKIAIYVCSGDEHAGIPNGNPTSKMKKGEFTISLMELQFNPSPWQYSFEKIDPQYSFDFVLPTNEKINSSLNREVWFLLHHIERTEDSITIKAELSKPETYGQNGKVNSFSKRIILDLSDKMLISPSEIEDNFTPDITIEIGRK